MFDNRERVPRDQLVDPLHFLSQTEPSAPGVLRHIQLIGCDGSLYLKLAASRPKFVTRGVSHAGAGGAEVNPIQAHPYASQLEGTPWQPGLDATIQRIVS